ncbi:MAG TPA: alpha/beta fold hydrolase [Candidatus Corynebacterium gallistercoris]|uniref:Alpha/beta fold hydrolase n=1 Tax=Candidatus Corynebacterium gallistercoris TaxID=2838530 RepID=A0A9D1RYC5_9CORY|nr:alpha/beta fold hydrolase [Candidatus Corynebacterium gallistercoris]
MRTRSLTALLAAFLTLFAAPIAAPAAEARTVPPTGTAPVHTGFMSAWAASVQNPGRMPAGVNDYSCQSETHPEPVVLVHGTWANAESSWTPLTQQLLAEDYCVFALNYGDESGSGMGLVPGVYGTQDLEASGAEVAAFIDDVLARTGANKVNLVGHSQGGTQLRSYVHLHGGQDKVRSLIGLGPNNHGTTLAGIAALGSAIQQLGVPVLDVAGIPLGQAGVQQSVGQPLWEKLNRTGETFAGIDHTVIATQYDLVVSPFNSQYLTETPGHSVNNIRLQDGCEQDTSDHLSILYSPRAQWYVLNALDPSYGQRTPQPCTRVYPFGGPQGSS